MKQAVVAGDEDVVVVVVGIDRPPRSEAPRHGHLAVRSSSFQSHASRIVVHLVDRGVDFTDPVSDAGEKVLRACKQNTTSFQLAIRRLK